MKIVTRKTEASAAAQRWSAQYDGGRYGEDKLETLKALKALGDNPDPDDVDGVIGNESWTTTKCNECKAVNINVVELGDEPDYESFTAHLCKECLTKALGLLD